MLHMQIKDHIGMCSYNAITEKYTSYLKGCAIIYIFLLWFDRILSDPPDSCSEKKLSFKCPLPPKSLG